MIQVKEFLNYQESQETKINEWLVENNSSIELIDIKYSVGTFQDSTSNSAHEYSGALIIFKTK